MVDHRDSALRPQHLREDVELVHGDVRDPAAMRLRICDVARVKQWLADLRELGGASRVADWRTRPPARARRPHDTHRALQVEQLLTARSVPVTA